MGDAASELEIDAVAARARRECPGLVVDDEAWRAHLRTLVTRANHEALHAGDLLLAFACAHASGAALQLFESRFSVMLADAVRAAAPGGAVDDVVQELRRRVLMSVDEAPPRILSYRGSGPLGGWLRVAALRIAIDARRAGWREVSIEDALVPERAAFDAQLRERDRAVVRGALREAIAAQPSRTRMLFRYYYAENVGVEELGTMYRVHASTVSRWLAQARADVFEATRRRLAEALRAAPSELESHLGLAHSLDVSLGSLLRTPGDG